ncbi:RluA family pseudouridine synthase [Simiduia curdlanivorans]|uniref:Pseudouridine synthase n=1 Tax=Simiduia curdlanivorans TaxID=1492769 RepID=A0ABV8V4D9_9GAMM|nr:RluA family pseudouridine synthase [Simiduia curdlanivorans]MDN3640106.1 RluA family pseudouridine synthase [Simiduia curdlanivorans]
MIKFHYTPPPGLPELLFQDDHLIVVAKPSGLLSNPGIAPETKDCLLSRCQAAYGELYLVHRLDCDTSGILVLARTKAAERHLKIQWQNRQVKKRYIAVVAGHITPEQGLIDKPLAANTEQPPLQKVCYYTGKPAQTEYRLQAHQGPNSKLELYPLTGRTHQLRVHLCDLGHPIIGDTFYGHDQAPTNTNNRLLLHANQLTFSHPVNNEIHTFSCPEDF